ncbi:MAG: hypothetical protein AB7V55_02720 [Oscillospiraceae bacterium]
MDKDKSFSSPSAAKIEAQIKEAEAQGIHKEGLDLLDENVINQVERGFMEEELELPIDKLPK